jgi:hypothetical protein
MIEIDSTSPLALGIGQEGSFGLGDVYSARGKAEAVASICAVRDWRDDRHSSPPRPSRRRAPRVLRRRLALELEDTASPPEPLRVASMWARIGEAEQAARWVQRAYDARSMALPFLGVMPPYDGVRDHPRIRAVLQRLSLTEAAERIGRLRPVRDPLSP